jgi:polysaccharide export outer membrane protein
MVVLLGRTLLAAVAVFTLSCLAAAQARLPEYVVGAQDVLAITVHGQPTLSGRYEVSDDGMIVFPLVGSIKALGVSADAIRDDLRKRLADGYLKNPEVAVTVDRHVSQQVNVIGEVRQPGSYPISGRLTVLDALTRAGFTTADAAGEILVIRSAEEQTAGSTAPAEASAPLTERIDLRRLQEGSIVPALLRDGDTVLVPKAAKVYVFGHVRTPGAYAYQQGMTVLELLAMAGGITERGSDHRLRVVRLSGDTRREISVKLGDQVQPGDTLKVPERFF